jgi:hypothetical protein
MRWGCACGVGSGGAPVEVRAVTIFSFLHSKGYPSITVKCGIVVNGANLSYQRDAEQVSKLSPLRPNKEPRLIERKHRTVKNALCRRLSPRG